MKKRKTKPEEKQPILIPTDEQLINSELMGWEHLGEGLFENKEIGMMGYFSPRGFEKEV